jgi:acyl-CoA synthetase (AMP-forming)/AMP-acid ligase II
MFKFLKYKTNLFNNGIKYEYKLFSNSKLLAQIDQEPVEYRELMKSFTNLKTSYATTVSEFPLVSNNIRQFLDEKASTLPNKLGYAFPFQGIHLTFSELKERVNTAAQNLLNLNFQKGDRIAIALPNSAELMITTLAASEIGLITVLLNPAYQTLELEYMLKKTSVKGLVIYDTFKVLKHIEIIQKLCPELESCIPGELNSQKLPTLKHIFVLNSPLIPEKKTYKGTWSFSELSEKKSSFKKYDLPYIDLDDPSLILFTVNFSSCIII